VNVPKTRLAYAIRRALETEPRRLAYETAMVHLFLWHQHGFLR
jgi:hypothetical protein